MLAAFQPASGQNSLHMQHMQQASPGKALYAMYLDRVSYFKNHPPGAGWDGVFTFKTK